MQFRTWLAMGQIPNNQLFWLVEKCVCQLWWQLQKNVYINLKKLRQGFAMKFWFLYVILTKKISIYFRKMVSLGLNCLNPGLLRLLNNCDLLKKCYDWVILQALSFLSFNVIEGYCCWINNTWFANLISSLFRI